MTVPDPPLAGRPAQQRMQRPMRRAVGVIGRGAGLGTLSGLLAGAAIGTAMVPLAGTVVGAVVGTAVGLVTGTICALVLALLVPAETERVHVRVCAVGAAVTAGAVHLLLLGDLGLNPAVASIHLSVCAGIGAAVGPSVHGGVR